VWALSYTDGIRVSSQHNSREITGAAAAGPYKNLMRVLSLQSAAQPITMMFVSLPRFQEASRMS
jgi:hypothetical protein